MTTATTRDDPAIGRASPGQRRQEVQQRQHLHITVALRARPKEHDQLAFDAIGGQSSFEHAVIIPGIVPTAE